MHRDDFGQAPFNPRAPYAPRGPPFQQSPSFLRARSPHFQPFVPYATNSSTPIKPSRYQQPRFAGHYRNNSHNNSNSFSDSNSPNSSYNINYDTSSSPSNGGFIPLGGCGDDGRPSPRNNFNNRGRKSWNKSPRWNNMGKNSDNNPGYSLRIEDYISPNVLKDPWEELMKEKNLKMS